VDLERLLVVRPTADAVSRVAVRIAEANIASVLVIDLSGAVPDLSVNDLTWQRTVRRLSLAIKSTATTILLITRAEQFQSLPLPTFLRLEFTRTSKASFEIRVGKERTGRISAPQSVPWSAFDPVGVSAPINPWAGVAARRVS
jgi:recombination protein RecA